MKLTVMALLLLASFCQAADDKESSRSKQKTEQRNIKRTLVEGNTSVEKRAPLLPNAVSSVTPGIEYAPTKDSHADKSPAQQIYATPVPQIAKISDVLTGHGPAFQAAIASHLYSPVSVYQPRLSSPTTYEVSPPVPANLAYSEKISFQPNAVQPVQYTPQLYNQKQPQRPLARLAVPQQQILVQPVYQQQQPNLQIYQIPQNPQVYHVQLPYNQFPQGFQAYPQNVQQVYAQPLAQNDVQPGIVYAKEEVQREQLQQPIQREQKIAQPPVTKILEKQTPSEQNYNTQPQSAISYASFSQSQPTPSYAQQQYQPQIQTQNHYQALNQHQAQNQHQTRLQAQSQPQYLIQAQPQKQALTQQLSLQSESQNQYQAQQTQPQYQTQPQPQIRVQLVQSQPQYQPQPQPQYQRLTQIQFQNAQPQYTKLEPSPANFVSTSVKSTPDTQYLRPGLVHIQAASSVQPQYFQPQVYAGPEGLTQNSGYGALAVAPTFPPIQYFGKFAQAIFGGYQQ